MVGVYEKVAKQMKGIYTWRASERVGSLRFMKRH